MYKITNEYLYMDPIITKSNLYISVDLYLAILYNKCFLLVWLIVISSSIFMGSVYVYMYSI